MDGFSRYIIAWQLCRTMKAEDVKNTNDYAPAELTERIREWVDYYNYRRYHEAIDKVTPADKHDGRDRVVLRKREKVRA